MSSSGLPGTAIRSAKNPALIGPRVCLGLAHLVAVDRHRAQDVGVRDAGVLPGLDELDAHFAARLARRPSSRRRWRTSAAPCCRRRSSGRRRCAGTPARDTGWPARPGGVSVPARQMPFCAISLCISSLSAARVRDRPDAGLDRVPRAVQRLHVAFDLHARLRGLADDQPDLVGGVAVRLAVHADLDHLRAEQHVLADRLDDLVRRVGVEILRDRRCCGPSPSRASGRTARPCRR